MSESVLSVGIDIGTTTTQLVFSRITIDNTAPGFRIPRISITGKEIVYKSGIYFTPFISRNEIDGAGIKEIIQQEYKKFNVTPEQIDTGAVIITGETAAKSNASEILNTLSGLAGNFVVAAAGPDLEAIIAGKGSGAEKISREESCIVANLDIGGGTTNIAVFKDGEVIDTLCLNIGGRLIKFDESNRITYISREICNLAEESGIHIHENDPYGSIELNRIIERMAAVLEEALWVRPRTTGFSKVLMGHDLRGGYKIDFITFSGGVAGSIYEDSSGNPMEFGDIGILLGKAVKKSALLGKYILRKPSETIRATVVGAGSHTTEISGSTIMLTGDILPLRNIPIIKLSSCSDASDIRGIEEEIAEKLKWFQAEKDGGIIALAFKGPDSPGFKDIQQISRGIISGMGQAINQGPLIVAVECDIAKVLGHALLKQLGYKKEIICIDGIRVENGDYIDIGSPVAGGRSVPVVIKTLVFNS